eukprot:COSAG06_NODE_243_length_19221_cov_15.057578_5_plen_52_part_00
MLQHVKFIAHRGGGQPVRRPPLQLAPPYHNAESFIQKSNLMIHLPGLRARG